MNHRCYTPQVTAAGYQANLATHYENQDFAPEADTLEAIANITVASPEDKQTISALTDTKATLVQELVSLHKEITACRQSSMSDGPSPIL